MKFDFSARCNYRFMIEFVFKVLVRYYEMMLSVGKFEGKDVRNRILEETL